MYKIQCDKGMEYMTKLFISAAGIDCEITGNNDCDCLILLHADLKLINNINSDCIIIANADDFSLMRTLENVENTIITCGLLGISTVTASSIEDEVCVLCLQREIQSFCGKKVIPQELPVHITGMKLDVNQIMLMLALGLICDADYEKIKKIKLC